MRNVKYREVRYAINRDNNEPYCRYLVKIYTLLTFIDTVSYMLKEKEGGAEEIISYVIEPG